MLVCPADLNVLENFIYGDTPDESALRSLLAEIFSLGQDFDVSLYTLSDEHDIRPLVLRTLLTYLELGDYLRSGTPFYANYQFKTLWSPTEILARFSGERRDFVAALFDQSVKARTWFSLDLEQAVKSLNTTRERIVTALDWLGEQQMLEVKVAGIRYRYQRLQQPASTAELAHELHQRILKREQAEIHRLQQVLDLIALDGCQTNTLTAHFGEQREAPCGHCSWCQRGKSEIGPRLSAAINEDILEDGYRLRREQAELLTNARLLTRLLCGITSPRLSRSKLTAHELFGALKNVPFAEVLARVERDGN
jgi:ATP-dependent DNA helicase RecQ